ncbi:hypothetical protein HaLaN_11624 [Haematococcus lacustris]|uniref:Uncharacterized protein n=1 Tax=Haematococcus lacustris TaxID=44745 RepID=A0A699Z081_HAELA|nr:hypothetical protein HaLaN_11624 [Haematococcus lacustris]
MEGLWHTGFQPYSAGAALLWLRGEPLRLGQDEVVNRVLLNCPQLLAVEVEQLDAASHRLVTLLAPGWAQQAVVHLPC